MSRETYEEMGQNVRIIELMIKGFASGGFAVLAWIMFSMHVLHMHINLPTAFMFEGIGMTIGIVVGGILGSLKIM
ncbi:MAG: hypothetical protein OEV42_16005 [Deltaproteobacteria bacterium]|nr:hypothetical protein [Deltaproteobacteria bacterium]